MFQYAKALCLHEQSFRSYESTNFVDSCTENQGQKLDWCNYLVPLLEMPVFEHLVVSMV